MWKQAAHPLPAPGYAPAPALLAHGLTMGVEKQMLPGPCLIHTAVPYTLLGKLYAIPDWRYIRQESFSGGFEIRARRSLS